MLTKNQQLGNYIRIAARRRPTHPVQDSYCLHEFTYKKSLKPFASRFDPKYSIVEEPVVRRRQVSVTKSKRRDLTITAAEEGSQQRLLPISNTHSQVRLISHEEFLSRKQSQISDTTKKIRILKAVSRGRTRTSEVSRRLLPRALDSGMLFQRGFRDPRAPGGANTEIPTPRGGEAKAIELSTEQCVYQDQMQRIQSQYLSTKTRSKRVKMEEAAQSHKAVVQLFKRRETEAGIRSYNRSMSHASLHPVSSTKRNLIQKKLMDLKELVVPDIRVSPSKKRIKRCLTQGRLSRLIRSKVGVEPPASSSKANITLELPDESNYHNMVNFMKELKSTIEAPNLETPREAFLSPYPQRPCPNVLQQTNKQKQQNFSMMIKDYPQVCPAKEIHRSPPKLNQIIRNSTAVHSYVTNTNTDCPPGKSMLYAGPASISHQTKLQKNNLFCIKNKLIELPSQITTKQKEGSCEFSMKQLREQFHVHDKEQIFLVPLLTQSSLSQLQVVVSEPFFSLPI